MGEGGEVPQQVQSKAVLSNLNSWQQKPLPGETLLKTGKELPTWQPHPDGTVTKIGDTEAIVVRTSDGRVIAWNSVGWKTQDMDDESKYNYGQMSADIRKELTRRGLDSSDVHVYPFSAEEIKRLADLSVDFEHLTAGKDWGEYEVDPDDLDNLNSADLIPF